MQIIKHLHTHKANALITKHIHKTPSFIIECALVNGEFAINNYHGGCVELKDASDAFIAESTIIKGEAIMLKYSTEPNNMYIIDKQVSVKEYEDSLAILKNINAPKHLITLHNDQLLVMSTLVSQL